MARPRPSSRNSVTVSVLVELVKAIPPSHPSLIAEGEGEKTINVKKSKTMKDEGSQRLSKKGRKLDTDSDDEGASPLQDHIFEALPMSKFKMPQF